MSDENSLNAVELATELTIAWLGNQNNRVSAEDVPAFLRTMHATVTELAGGSSTPVEAAAEEASPEQEFTPAVTVRKSLGSKDHIISMIDGKPYKTLKRHLSGHGLTPEHIASATICGPTIRWSPRTIQRHVAKWRTRSAWDPRDDRPKRRRLPRLSRSRSALRARSNLPEECERRAAQSRGAYPL